MADYVLIYDTSTGRLKAKLAETAQIADGAVTSAKLASGQVGSPHVAPAAIVSALIASGQVGSLHVAPAAIVSANIASGQLGTDHFAPGQIVSAYIGAGEIGGGLIKDGGILSGKYGASSIRIADIGDAQIVSAKIASGQVGSLHVAPAAIVSALIASGHIGSLHVKPAAIISSLIASGTIGNNHIASGQVKTTDASLLTTGLLAHARISGLPLASLVAAVCSETEAAGLVTTHAGLKTGIHGLTIVRKTSDQTVNDSNTLVNCTQLLFAVGISEIWEFFMWGLHNASGDGDIKFGFTVPTNGVIHWFDHYRITSCGAYGALSVIGAGDTTKWEGTGADAVGVLWGIYIGGDTAGNVQFQFAQYTAHASDAKILTNSNIIARRIA